MNLGSVEPPDHATALAAAIAGRAEAQGIGIRREVGRGETIFEQGSPPDRGFILHSGLVKLVYVTASGEEWIKSLIAARSVIGPSGRTAPMTYAAIAIEQSMLVALPVDWLIREIAASPDLAAAHGRFIDWVRLRKEAREHALLCQSAEERYRDLLAREPDLIARLAQADIARFLRITPVAFSRIKRRMRGESQGIRTTPVTL